MEEEQKKGKNHVGILVCIIFILIILLGACIFLLFQEKANNNKTNIDTEEKETKKHETEKTQEEKFDSVSLDDTMVVKLNKLNPKNLCGQTNLELEKRNRNVNEISSIEKIRMLASCGDLEGIDTNKATISEESIKKYFEDTSFLEKYKNGVPDGETLGYIFYDKVRYENNQLIFINNYGVGCEGPSQGTFLSLHSAKKNSKEMILNYTLYYREADREEKIGDNYYFIFKYYKDKTKTEYLGEGKEYNELDSNSFSGYQFVFNIEDGNYQLKAINYLSIITEG